VIFPEKVDGCVGRFLVRGGATELIEGGPQPKTIVIIEFPDTAALKRRYDSPEYRKILPSRLENSTCRLFIVEDVSHTHETVFKTSSPACDSR
jgi:uncharacterized protein (DUF1330 family)